LASHAIIVRRPRIFFGKLEMVWRKQSVRTLL
jgi:hypothetical protein